MAEANFNETVSALFKGMDAFISTKTVVGDVVKIDEDTYNEAMQALSESRNMHEESINRLEQALNDPRVQVIAKKG